jgi:hypothetical protein
MKAMNIDYDRRFDTLYIALGNTSNSYGDDSLGDIILMRDMATDDITGITILSFLKKCHAHTFPKLPESLNLSIEKDILPLFE